MAQRQFASGDTSIWQERFGLGGDGAVSATTGTDAPIDSACTGTAGATALTATNASFASGQIIIIDQTRGTNANADPSWELNVVSSYATGTITTKYALTRSYTTGAQVQVLSQLSSYNLNGATVTGKAWDTAVGGLFARLVNGPFFGTGTLTLAGKGFQGGPGSASDAGSGEGYPGGFLLQTAANGNGGGGRPSGGGGAGGGGGNGGAGSAGSGGQPGDGGGTSGNASLTIFSMGGGGGGGRDGSNGSGGRGGGKILIIAKSINIASMTISLIGDNGQNANAAGGGGGGGSALFKGQTIVLGSTTLTATGGSGGGGGFSTGGNGGTGRVHADYSGSLSGTTSPSADSTLDSTLADNAGLFLMF